MDMKIFRMHFSRIPLWVVAKRLSMRGLSVHVPGPGALSTQRPAQDKLLLPAGGANKNPP